MTKTSNLHTALKSGANMTAKQISAQFKIKNAREAVRSLRESGVCIYGNPAVMSDGTKTTKYRIGTPTKAMVAAAYASVGGELFTG
jgi:hypothetical protein